MLGVLTDIGTAIGQNFFLSILNPGDYLFTLSNLADDLQSGQLLVSRVVVASEPETLVLLGLPLIGIAIAMRRRRR